MFVFIIKILSIIKKWSKIVSVTVYEIKIILYDYLNKSWGVSDNFPTN